MEGLKRIHANPEYQAKRLEVLKIYNSSPEHLEHFKRINADTEYQVKRLKHLKRLQASMKGRPKPEGAGRPSVSI